MQCRKDPKDVNKKEIKKFLDKFVEKKSPGNTINVYLNALKFLYEQILNKKLTIKIKYSKTPQTLPTVLTKDETQILFKTITNKKHKLMIQLLYSAGLRVSELVKLKVQDIDLQNNQGWVRKGKGNKDRLFVIAESIKQELKNHIATCTGSWLFKGQRLGTHLSVRSIQQILKTARKNAKLNKNIHPHTLRHSFATHLIENGYAVAHVQSLLGHASAETTMVYVHLAQPRMLGVQSPLDTL